MLRTLAVAALALAALQPAVRPLAAQAPDSGSFIIRLGHDTTVIERYVRTADRLVAEAVQRSPSTVLHRLELRLDAQGQVVGGEWTARAPGAAEPSVRREFQFRGDSATVTTTQGGATRTQNVAARGAIPLAGPFYAPYELALMRGARAGGARADIPLLPGGSVVTTPVQRVGGDTFSINNQFGEPMQAQLDGRGRLVRLWTPAFTTVERVGWLDLDRLAADFAERDRTGRGLGALSPRQTTRQRVGEANVWLDYSRPAMRGRPIWGALVPWGQVWRMGANDAAHLATDRTLQLGDITLEPGTYTLFLLPTEQAWTLIVSRATGISGLEHDPAHDVGRTVLRTETLAAPAESFTMQVAGSGDDARLAIQWDRTRATVPLRVR